MSGTITHEWVGTTLVVTSDSGTSSCDLKGAKGDMGIRGVQGIPGIGIQGASPVKGVDYWTEADKAELVEDVLLHFPEAEGGEF